MGLLAGYEFRKQITIAGTAAGAQTDYAIKLIVHRGAGTDSGNEVYLNNKCKVDFADIRFTKPDGTTELSHWRQEYIENDKAIFWIKFDSIPASPESAVFYIYYENYAAATASDDSGSFLAGADFDDGATTGLTINTAGSASVTVPAITQLFSKIKVDDWIRARTQNPVLAVRAGKWDSASVRDLCPVMGEDGYLAYESEKIVAFYNGHNGVTDQQIGRATSADRGLTWGDRLDTPVISLGDVGSWYNLLVIVGSVAKRNDGLYVAFVTGKSSDGVPHIGVFTSDDLGLTWSDCGVALEVDDFNHPSGAIGAMGCSWVIKRDADYIMLFEAAVASTTTFRIFAATATDLVGPWTPFNSGDPILPLGSAGQWDDLEIANPKLVRLAAGQYLLAYNGMKSGVGKWRIGFATCTTDFTDWTKHTGNPVIQEEGTGWEQTQVECAAMVKDSSTHLRLWYHGYDGSNNPQVGLAKCHNGRMLHGLSAAAADGYLIGSMQANPFWSSVLLRNTLDSSGSSVIAAPELLDYASVPSPAANTTYNPWMRFGIRRYSPTSTHPDTFFIYYVDGSDVTHYWDGNAWQLTTTYFGGPGIYEVRVWDDGTNFKADIVEFFGDVSILAAVATIAKASVQTFSSGRALVVGDPYTSHYYLGQYFDNIIVRKYTSPEPTWDAWGAAEDLRNGFYIIGNLDLVYGRQSYLLGDINLSNSTEWTRRRYLLGDIGLVYEKRQYLLGDFDLTPGGKAYLQGMITVVDRLVKPIAGSCFIRTPAVSKNI